MSGQVLGEWPGALSGEGRDVACSETTGDSGRPSSSGLCARSPAPPCTTARGPICLAQASRHAAWRSSGDDRVPAATTMLRAKAETSPTERLEEKEKKKNKKNGIRREHSRSSTT